MKIAERIGDFLLPLGCTCFCCDAETEIGEDFLCDECRKQLRFCSSAITQTPLDGFTAGLLYDGLAATMVRGLKYSEKTKYARTLAYYIEIPEDWAFDCIVPVPLHPLKKFLRRFNQSAMLAEELRLNPPVPIREKLLRRVRFTRTQTTLNQSARERNVKDAFRADARAFGLSILLIDDVSTTLSTLKECAKALKKAGAVRVYAAAACMVKR